MKKQTWFMGAISAAMVMLSGCGSAPQGTALSSQPPAMTQQSITAAKVTVSKSVDVPYYDATGRFRGNITVTVQVLRDGVEAYAKLSYSDTTDIGGYGPFQSGRVSL